MPKFDCESCGRALSVPDKYAGKRVRCPGCQAPQRVPMPGPSASEQPMAMQAPVDFSALDDSTAQGVRRLRQILIGCGVCQKTIKVPESKLGKTMACSLCNAVLKVDAFNLSKAKGDLIDMTHLELEKADLLLDGGSQGSTLGGSSIQLDGSGSASGGAGGGYELNTPPPGSMSGVSLEANSQTQMRELRELNDLKHSGQISNDEYRERKKAIYAGKTLAIQAMSRSADGSGNRPVLNSGDGSGLLPGPVKALIAVAVVGGIAFAGWSMLSGPQGTPGPAPQDTQAQSPNDPPPGNEAEALTDTAQDAEQDSAIVDTAVPEPSETDASSVDSLAVDDTPAQEADDLAVTLLHLDDDLGTFDAGASEPEPQAEPQVTMQVVGWTTPWPDYTLPPDDDRAIGKACQIVQRMEDGANRALIGVALGPAVDGFSSPHYTAFRQEMHSILTDTARQDGIYDDLNIQDSEDATTQFGSLEAHRLHVTSRNNRGKRATILTGIQDGQSVAYWFAGDRGLYRDFLDTVGQAEFAPIQ